MYLHLAIAKEQKLTKMYKTYDILSSSSYSFISFVLLNISKSIVNKPCLRLKLSEVSEPGSART